MIRDLVCVAVGVLFSGIAFAVWEWASSRPRRHRLRANYFDARSPFAIVRVGRDAAPERTDERVDRVAARLGRLKRRRYADADDAS